MSSEIEKILEETEKEVMGGTVSVLNSGGYVAKFSVTYLDKNKKERKYNSGNFTAGVVKDIKIPAGASNIHVRAEAAIFFGSWSTIFNDSFMEPVNVKYTLSGTTLNTKWKKDSL